MPPSSKSPHGIRPLVEAGGAGLAPPPALVFDLNFAIYKVVSRSRLQLSLEVPRDLPEELVERRE